VVTSRRLLSLRFDGVEALVLALLFAVVVGGLRYAVPGLPIRLAGLAGIGAGLAGVTGLRLVRTSRAQPSVTPGGELVGARSLVALLLLGVGWFVVVLGVLAVVVVTAFLGDVRDADRTAILVPMVPLALGAALVFGGLRIKRLRAPAPRAQGPT
jgi:hypothetical protein